MAPGWMGRWRAGGGALRWRWAAAILATLFGLPLALVACAAPPAIQAEQLPPLHDVNDRSASNAAAVFAFLSGDAGWQAWLQAAAASQRAEADLVDASTADVPAWRIDAELTLAKDAYRRATSFYLVPVILRSSCLNLASETNGSLRLESGLLLRYRSFATGTHRFSDGTACRQSTGYVSEVDSARGLPIFTAPPGEAMNWQQNLAGSLVWARPFAQISRDNSYSVDELIALIGR